MPYPSSPTRTHWQEKAALLRSMAGACWPGAEDAQSPPLALMLAALDAADAALSEADRVGQGWAAAAAEGQTALAAAMATAALIDEQLGAALDAKAAAILETAALAGRLDDVERRMASLEKAAGAHPRETSGRRKGPRP